MARYSEERKQQILSKLLPPSNLSVAEVARTEGVGLQTLYKWRDKVRQQGRPVPGNKSTLNIGLLKPNWLPCLSALISMRQS